MQQGPIPMGHAPTPPREGTSHASPIATPPRSPDPVGETRLMPICPRRGVTGVALHGLDPRRPSVRVHGGGGRMKPSCMRDFVSSRARRIISRAPRYSSSRVFVTRAIPWLIAFSPTAVASRANTSISSIVGTMWVSSSPFSSATLASSSAAAMHISSVIVRARTSSVPRKIPGNPSELLTWFGKSERPVAMTRAPASAASHGHISRTCEGDRDVGNRLADDLQRVDDAREVDRRGPLLVVVPDRDLALLPQPLKDVEALRLRDVLQVHAAERWRDQLDRLDDLLGVLRREREGERVDAAEVLEEERLALHDGQARLRSDVAEAEDPRPVGDDRDLIPFVRQGPDLLRVRLDVEARLGDAGRVPDCEVVEGPHGHARHDFDLALVIRVVLRGLFFREVRPAQVLLHLFRRWGPHPRRAHALLRRQRNTGKAMGR